MALQPQQDSPYNNAVWDAQIHPKMYDIYMKAFAKHASPEVKCKLFCAYYYVGKRKTIWGSWGHLESLEQLKDLGNIHQVAPKYSALIDANTTE